MTKRFPYVSAVGMACLTLAACVHSGGEGSSSDATKTFPAPERLELPDHVGAVTVSFEQAMARQFTTKYALKWLEQVAQGLYAFVELTETVKAERNIALADPIPGVPSTGWERQNLGFSNMIITIEGTLIRNAYDIARLEYELARARHESGQATAEEVEAAMDAHREARVALERFWTNRYFVAD